MKGGWSARVLAACVLLLPRTVAAQSNTDENVASGDSLV